MDEEQARAWLEAMEEPIWASVEALYEHAGLSHDEVAALEKYRSRVEYSLLRWDRLAAIDIDGPSFLRRIAGYLRWLNSEMVVGPDGQEPARHTFVREMFRGSTVHKWEQEEIERILESGEVDKGVLAHYTARSTALIDKYSELEVLAFFCANGFEVEFPAASGPGKKPEFYVAAEPHRIGVEVKNLDSATAQRHIFGGPERHLASPPPDGNLEIPNDVAAVVGTINTQYRNAREKFTGVPILVVIYFPWPPSLLEPKLSEWLRGLANKWDAGKDSGVAGIVLAGLDVHTMVNPSHRELMAEFRFGSVPLKHLCNVYVECAESDLWPD